MTAPAAPPTGGLLAAEELLDQLVPGPSAVRRVVLLLVVAVLGFGLVVVPSEGFQTSYDDWRHTEDLRGDARVLDGPLGMRSQPAVVALGDGRVLVWGGRGVTADSGVLYDPATGEWEDLPPAPGPSRFSAAAVWTGQEALIWGGSTSQGSFDFDPGGIAWNPTTETWRTLPSAPVGLNGARAAAFEGGVLFMGGDQHVLGSPPTSLWLDLAAGTWTQIPAPLVVVSTARLGDRLLATGPQALGPGRQPTSGWAVVAFDPATSTWAPYAAPLVTDWMALAVSDDGTVSAVTHEALNDPLRAYTWTGWRWDLAAESKRSAEGLVTIEYVTYPPVAAWTGEQLLLGGNGGLTGWDPDREVFAFRGGGPFHTFGGSAVWTGQHLVAPVNQGTVGWIFTPA